MVRIYLRFIIDVLDKLKAAYCWQAYDLISELCSETNVDFFNELSDKLHYTKNYSSVWFFFRTNCLIIFT